MSKKTNTDKTDFYVEEQYRTNPLSRIPAPNEVKIDNKIYNNIHYPDSYLAVVSQNRQSNSNWSNNCSNSTDEIFSIEDLVVLYGGNPSEMDDDEMERFIELQERDYHD